MDFLPSLLGAALIAGLMGGAHCAAMCGGIVGAVSHGQSAARWRLALAYNAGRIATYTFAGALAGALGQSALWLRGGAMARHTVMAMAGAALILLALYVAGLSPLVRAVDAAGSVIWRRVQPWSRHFLPADTVPRSLGLGLLWGWLPCGMVYAVLLTALSTGSALDGAIVMAAFGVGTLPNLLAVTLFIDRFRAWGRSRLARLVGAAVIAIVGIFAVVHAVHPPSKAPVAAVHSHTDR
jgi:sulfite exporter TauE/SafE